MDKLRAMEAFVRIVDRGSLTAAAESLRTSLPSVVRTLASLEAALDTRLINRTTRRIALTDEGRDYYARCQRVLADIDEAEATLSARRIAPKGRLRLTAPVTFGRMHVAPVVTDFIGKHEAVQVELMLLDRVVDLVDEGIDIGVRIGHLPDSSLVALPIGETMSLSCCCCRPRRRPAQLRGHGGPVRAIAVAPDGKPALSGSFDTSAILWSLAKAPPQVLRFHEGAVNAVALLPDGRVATGGEDGRIAIWQPGEATPARCSRATRRRSRRSPCRRTARCSPRPPGTTPRGYGRSPAATPRVLEGHGQCQRRRLPARRRGRQRRLRRHAAHLAARRRRAARSSRCRRRSTPSRSRPTARSSRPAPTAGVFPDRRRRARGRGRGRADADHRAGRLGRRQARRRRRHPRPVAIIDRATRKLARTLVGPGLPVWSLAFFPDGRTLLTGGTDRMVRRWNAVTGEPIGDVALGAPEDPLAAYAGDPGAEVFRACVACHTLTPTTATAPGRRCTASSAAGSPRCPATISPRRSRRWTSSGRRRRCRSCSRSAPTTYTPGTKMPEQRIGSPEDRAALMRFLEKATR